MTNRVLLLSALARGVSTVENVLDSADTQHMMNALLQLEVPIDFDKRSNTAVISGRAGPLTSAHGTSAERRLFLGNAGTAMRPLTAVLATGYGSFVLDGTQRMQERPIQDLVDALREVTPFIGFCDDSRRCFDLSCRQLNVDIRCSATGCPPVHINARGIAGGEVTIAGNISSQYLSALLMAAPLAAGAVTIRVKGDLMSAPYVQMTLRLMQRFGVHVAVSGDMREFVVSPSTYQSPGRVFVEGDASSASYFLAGAVLCPAGGRVTVHGVARGSLQGDVRFVEILQKMGASVAYDDVAMTVSRDAGVVLQGVDEDCGDIPDVAMTLAIVGLFARGRTIIRNVYNWRVKESERMVAIVTEMRKLGATVEEGRDYLIVHGLSNGDRLPRLKNHVYIDTYDDHRMAMCFSLAACAGVTVHIRDPACVTKTFPTFFQELTSCVQTKT